MPDKKPNTLDQGIESTFFYPNLDGVIKVITANKYCISFKIQMKSKLIIFFSISSFSLNLNRNGLYTSFYSQ